MLKDSITETKQTDQFMQNMSAFAKIVVESICMLYDTRTMNQ
jgi:hypothetical protein